MISRSFLCSSLIIAWAATFTVACSKPKQAAKVETKAAETAAAGENEKVKAKEKEKEKSKEEALGASGPKASGDDDIVAVQKPDANEVSDYTQAELMAKMSWIPKVENAQTGKLYSGFDGTNKFSILLNVLPFGQLPAEIEAKLSDAQFDDLYFSDAYAAAALVQKAALSVTADPLFATIKPFMDAGSGKLLEVLTVKAGMTALKVKLGSKEISLPFQITPYTVAQIAAGRNRYNTAVTGATPSPACKSCHNGMGPAPDHSPLYLAQYSDASLLATAETGINEYGEKTNIAHKWTFVSATDRAGIVPYLRSIPIQP